jgi:hypothetical protein
LVSSLALAGRVTGWLLVTQARLGMTGEGRAALTALDDEWAMSGEIGNARAVICLADGDPGGALTALWDVLDGTAQVIGYHTVVEAHLLAGLGYRELGDQRAANQAAERALALAEADRLVLPFAMTGPRSCSRRYRGMRQLTPRCSPTSSMLCGAHPRCPKTCRYRCKQGSSARASSGYCDIFRRTCPGLRSPPHYRCR